VSNKFLALFRSCRVVKSRMCHIYIYIYIYIYICVCVCVCVYTGNEKCTQNFGEKVSLILGKYVVRVEAEWDWFRSCLVVCFIVGGGAS
jgi:hypothetical protein